MGLLYILLLFILGAGFLTLLWYLFGKGGLLAFAPFATILANYQASIGLRPLFGAGSLEVMPSVATYVLLATALVLMLHKFGTKSAMLFIVVVITTAVLDVVSDQVIAAFEGSYDTVDLLPVMRTCFANIVASISSGFCTIVFYNIFKKKHMNYLLNIVLTLSIMLAFDALVFLTINLGGILPIGDLLLAILNNWWNKLVVVVLITPVIYGILKIKNFDVSKELDVNEDGTVSYDTTVAQEAVVIGKIKEEPIEVVEEKVEVEPAKKVVATKKPAAKKPATAKPATKATSAKTTTKTASTKTTTKQ